MPLQSNSRASRSRVRPATRLLLCLLLTLLHLPQSAAQTEVQCTAAWWNVENLFDPTDDSLTKDDDFTPEGSYHWTYRKLNTKLQGLAKTLIAMKLPDVVGMAEVENARVLQQLCQSTPLVRAGYDFVHHDSPDRRGIDVALLYRKECFYVLSDSVLRVSDSAGEFFTRDILFVRGLLPSGDTLLLFLCHLPSKRGGAEAEARRVSIAALLRQTLMQAHKQYPTAPIIVMGDFNATADEPPIANGLAFAEDSLNPDGLLHLNHRLPHDMGTYKYQGSWSYLDHLFFLAAEGWTTDSIALVQLPHLLQPDARQPGVHPYRTHLVPRYMGGYSDHLPLWIRLKKRVSRQF